MQCHCAGLPGTEDPGIGKAVRLAEKEPALQGELARQRAFDERNLIAVEQVMLPPALLAKLAAGQEASGRSLSGRGALLQPVVLAIVIGAVVLLGWGGVTLWNRMHSFPGKDAEKPEHTASIRPVPAPSQADAAPAEIDLAYAKAAAAQLLGRPEKNGSQLWENPGTGARGTITAIADAYTSDGFQCRDFLASYVRDGAESWLQGDACRIHQGKWTVRSMRPLKRT